MGDVFIRRRIRKNYAWMHFYRDYPVATICGGILLVAAILLAPFMDRHSDYFKASLVDYHDVVFEGAAMPIKKVPNWVALTDAERKYTYNRIPTSKLIDIPEYNPKDIRAGYDWRTGTDDQRNAYITYPVPHLGNYKLDGTEDSGSHPGIDIKIPIGTPVYAIANGVIEKSENQATGFGLHVVIKHPDVPDPKYVGEKVTLFSGYAHLSQLVAKKGRQVKKGDLIGYSGDTGMATAPHLHFQIDRFGAPYHLHWPFSWKEVESAGYSSYFEAVKNGLNQSVARENTVHPIEFIEKNINVRNLIVSSEIPDEVFEKIIQEEKKEEVKEIVQQEERVEIQVPQVEEKVIEKNEVEVKTPIIRNAGNPAGAKPVSVDFKSDGVFTPGTKKQITLVISNIGDDVITLRSTLRGLAPISPDLVMARDLDQNNSITLTVDPNSNRDFRIIASGNFGEIKSEMLKAQIFSDIAADSLIANAVSDLKGRNVIKGYEDNTFRPENTLNRAEALKIILLANRKRVGSGNTNFSDVEASAWFAPYVATAVEREIVQGYPDNTFRPANTMTRAEFLKVAILTSGFGVSDRIDIAPYEDVDKSIWFAPYFSFSRIHNLINSVSGNVYPSQQITRGEAVEVIYKLSQIRR